MEKKNLIYIPIVLLFLFSMSALVGHYANIGKAIERASYLAELPFGHNSGRVLTTTPQAESAGIKTGDRIDAINGVEVASNENFDNALSQMRGGEPVELSMLRPLPDGSSEKYAATVLPIAIERNFNYYSKNIVGFIFTYALPTVCSLFGFWVLVRSPEGPSSVDIVVCSVRSWLAEHGDVLGLRDSPWSSPKNIFCELGSRDAVVRNLFS